MNDLTEMLAQSRTFKVVNGQLTAEAASVEADNSTPRRATAALQPGTFVGGQYKIGTLLGQGGMGAVYSAHHQTLNREVALKTFLHKSPDAGSWERFRREALSLGKMRHPNIVEIFDFGLFRFSEAELPYFTMELLHGQSLADHLATAGRLALADAIAIFIQVADALSHAHKAGIIHRDIKPGNIFLLESRRNPGVKVVDFGIAKLAEAGDKADSGQTTTSSGTIFGSPLYMSPEQSRAGEIDGRTDLYSFGCALFETITGAPPYMENNALATIMAHQSARIPSLKERCLEESFSQRLESLVTGLLAKDPNDRPKNFDYVRNELMLCQNASIPPVVTSITEENSDQSQAATKNKRLPWLIAGAAISVAVLAAAIAYSVSKPAQVKSEIATAVDSNALSNHAVVQEPPFAMVTNGGKTTIDFGEGTPYAQIGINTPEDYRELKSFKCVGKVTLPAATGYYLFCHEGIPVEFIRRFPPNSIIRFAMSNENCSVDYLKAILKHNGLIEIDLHGASLSKEAIVVLKQFKQIEYLDFDSSNLTGDDIAPLTAWPNLKMLRAKSITNAGTVCKSAVPATLRSINFTADELTDEDLIALGKITTLENLGLSDNFITARGIKYLQNLPKISVLDLLDVSFGPEIIDAFAGFRSVPDYLRRVQADFSSLSPDQIKRLQKALGKDCHILNISKSVKAGKRRASTP